MTIRLVNLGEGEILAGSLTGRKVLGQLIERLGDDPAEPEPRIYRLRRGPGSHRELPSRSRLGVQPHGPRKEEKIISYRRECEYHSI